MTFLLQLLYCHLLGFAISFGVSFVLFPTTSLETFAKLMTQCASAAISTLQANCALRRAFEDNGAGTLQDEIAKYRQQTSTLATLQVKLAGAEAAASQEFSIRGPKPRELEEASRRMRDVLTALIGTDHLTDIAERVMLRQRGDERCVRTSAEYISASLQSVKALFDQACNSCSDSIELAMRHMLLYKDDGAHTKSPTHYDTCVARLQECLDLLLRSKEMMVTPFMQEVDSAVPCSSHKTALENEAIRAEMFALLHGEFLLWTTTRRILELLRFAKQLQAPLDRDRSWHQFRLSDARAFFHDASQQSLARFKTVSSLTDVLHSSAYGTPKRTADATQWSKGLVRLRSSLKLFASPAVGFGLRVAAATMSIAVVAMLSHTRAFFIKQHMIWAVYAVSYAMQASKGQSIRHFFYRFTGTVVGAAMAMISFYAVNGHAAGELTFYFLFMHIPIYIMLKHPRIQTTGTVTAFALTIILGNKLDLQKIGTPKAEEMDLAVQPIWLIGLIRLASVGGGLLLATIWTLLPFPMSEQDQVRHSVATCLNFLAKYYTSTYLATRSRLKSSPGKGNERSAEQNQQFEAARDPLRADIDGQLVSIHSQLSFTKWDLQAGSHFPKAQYDCTYNALDAIVRSLDIIRLAAIVFVDTVAIEEHLASSAWLRSFRNSVDRAESDSQQATMLLMVLANSLNTKTSLPPFLNVSDAYSLSHSLDEIDIDLLNVRHVSEPGLATFAAIQIEIQRIHRRLAELLTVVKDLVGELDVVLIA